MTIVTKQKGELRLPFLFSLLFLNLTLIKKKIEICQSASRVDFSLPLLHCKTLLPCYIIV